MKKFSKDTNPRGSLSLTSKLGEKEGIKGEEKSVKELIENDPIKLWSLIHSPNSKISLLKPTYFKLKDVVKRIAPELVEENDKISIKHKALKNLAKEKHLGIFEKPESKFKSIGIRLKK